MLVRAQLPQPTIFVIIAYSTEGGFGLHIECRGRILEIVYAGLSNARSHSGCRSFLTGLAHKGVNVRVLAALAGHSNISTTQRYIEVGEHQLRAAVELI